MGGEGSIDAVRQPCENLKQITDASLADIENGELLISSIQSVNDLTLISQLSHK